MYSDEVWNDPKMTSNGAMVHQKGAKMEQNDVRMALRWQPDGPRGFKMASGSTNVVPRRPKMHQDGPERPQDGSQGPQDGPKMDTRGPKMDPRWHQYGSNGSPRGFIRAKTSAKMISKCQIVDL